MSKKFVNEKKKVEEHRLEIGNIILAMIQTTPDRCIVGESYIHYMCYIALKQKEFKEEAKRVSFVLDEQRPYSSEVHTAVKYLSKDISEVRTPDEAKIPMIITERAREGYDEIKTAEGWMVRHIHEPMQPKIFALTPNGILVAAYSWASLMNQDQRDVLAGVIRETMR